MSGGQMTELAVSAASGRRRCSSQVLLWRPEAEMMANMPWMLLAQFLVAAAFTMIFAACVAEKRCMSCTIKFAASMGIFSGGGQLMMYAVQPLPGSLVAKWVLAAIVQAVLLGIIVHKVYRPAPITSGAAGK